MACIAVAIRAAFSADMGSEQTLPDFFPMALRCPLRMLAAVSVASLPMRF